MNSDALVAFFSDLHSGSTVGLAPVSWTLRDGGTYIHTTAQAILRRQWLEDWEAVKRARKNRRLIIGIVGDLIEGNHSETDQLITSNVNVHGQISGACIIEGLRAGAVRPDDKIFVYLGTHRHTGTLEETIAREIRHPKTNQRMVPPAIPPTAKAEYQDGRYVRPHHKFSVNGVLFDVAHEPNAGGGNRAWTKGNAFQTMLRSIYLETAERKQKLTRWFIRAHRHQYLHRHHEGPYGRIDGVILPAYQAKTDFANKVANDKLSDMGMSMVYVNGDGESWLETRCVTYDTADEDEL